MGLLLMVVCAAILGQYQVQAQDPVVCRASTDCTGMDLGQMTPSQCCVQNVQGLAFNRPGEEACIPCVVFGFFQESFIRVEQESSYTVQAGYQKGADVEARNLSFHVMATDGTAREGSNLDYTVSTTNVVSLYREPIPPDNVEFTLNVADIALENNETFSLQLVPSSSTTLPTGEGIFFLDTLSVTIIDNDIPQFSISPANIEVGEATNEVQVCVDVNITLDNTPVSVAGQTQIKTGATNQATAGSDYESAFFQVIFESSTQTQACRNIQIIDDELSNEPPEEFSVFLIEASPVPSQEFGIRESCITIIDNDIPVISLTPRTIEVFENASEVQVCITIDGSLARNVVVTADTVAKAGATNQATADSDYQTTQITVTFEPQTESVQTRCDAVVINDDIADEPDEEFSVRLTSASPVGNLIADETCITIIDDDQAVPVCHENADLDNSGEVPVCVCKPGFTGDGVTSCDDIDECAMDDDVCADFVTCSNLKGGYRCECTQDNGTNCITRNVKHPKTWTESSGSSQKKRSISSRSTSRWRSKAKCGCHKGYTLDPDGQTCIDVNECETGKNDCNRYVKCVNLPGTFKCVCNHCKTMYKRKRRPKNRRKWRYSRRRN